MRPDVFDILLMVFAAWRLTSIVNRERIAAPIRKVFGESVDAVGLPSYPANFFGYLISCFMCLSVWISLLVIGIWIVYPYILWPFALSAAVLLMEKHL